MDLSFLGQLAARLPGTPVLAFAAAAIVLAWTLWRVKVAAEPIAGFDIALVVVALGAGTAAAVPLVDSVQASAREAALTENLRTLRTQIELYKLQHGGAAPLLYKAGFPQLIQPTNARGVPGLGRQFTLGPYLPAGVPINPLGGSRAVTAVEAFPPAQPTGGRGWVYHQATGRIAPDLDGYLDR